MARITALSHKKMEDFTDSERIELIDQKHHLEIIYNRKLKVPSSDLVEIGVRGG